MLFGRAFPYVAQKHRQQLLSHFKECIRQAKGVRQQAIQINIFTAFLSALKVGPTALHHATRCYDMLDTWCNITRNHVYFSQNLVEAKAVLGQQELLTNAYGLIAVGSTCTPWHIEPVDSMFAPPLSSFLLPFPPPSSFLLSSPPGSAGKFRAHVTLRCW